MELRINGLRNIKCGPIPNDGTMSTMLTALGVTYKDSASFKEADPQVTTINSEENDFPEEIFQEAGEIVLTFDIMNYTPAVLAILKGGTVTGVGAAAVYKAPLTYADVEQSFQLIDKKDNLIEIPRMKVRAVLNAELKKQGVALINVKAIVLNPVSGIAPYSISKYVAPTVSAGADAASAVPNANLVGTAAASRGTLTFAWSVDSKPAASNPVFATPAALATAVSGMTAGVHKFKLTVTDSNGYSNSSVVTITAS